MYFEKRFFSLILVIFSITLSACGVETAMEKDLTYLKESKDLWKEKLNEHQSYEFTQNFKSWVGKSGSTKMKVLVQNSKEEVVSRTYTEFDINGEESDNWTEVKNGENETEKLGSHQYGEAIKTMTQIYQECELMLGATDRSENEVYLTFSRSGLLSECAYSPEGCSDDCFFGVRIDSVELMSTGSE